MFQVKLLFRVPLWVQQSQFPLERGPHQWAKTLWGPAIDIVALYQLFVPKGDPRFMRMRTNLDGSMEWEYEY